MEIVDSVFFSDDDEDEDDPEYQFKQLLMNDNISPMVNSSGSDMGQVKLKMNKKKRTGDSSS